MAVDLAKGKTEIYNAQCEPYIHQLCKMLIPMRATIKVIGQNFSIIVGVMSLIGVAPNGVPDMIAMGSWIG